MKECINCFKQIDDRTWCSTECKRKFLIRNYDPMTIIRATSEEHDKRMKKHQEAIKKMKESGLAASQYILGNNDKCTKNVSEEKK